VLGAWQIPELLILTGSAAKIPLETTDNIKNSIIEPWRLIIIFVNICWTASILVEEI
jgi:hypothetical protein